MQGPAWVALFRRIPPELHETIILVLTTGLEVVIQTVIRLERDFALIRGRMAGTMDGARVIILPYDQINYLAFNKKITEAESQTLLGKTQPVPAAEAAAEAAAAAAVEEEVLIQEADDGNLLPKAAVAPTTEPEQPAETAPNGAAPPVKPGQMSKSFLLARLRARLAKDGPASK